MDLLTCRKNGEDPRNGLTKGEDRELVPGLRPKPGYICVSLPRNIRGHLLFALPVRVPAAGF